ncbi:MAG: hypothetical protein B5M55_08335 [Desulfococcus sp. 4484_242]|nr:MAG: hypothetical protein B5M55_08335 [Desulfococcus sp. 4484_242]
MLDQVKFVQSESYTLHYNILRPYLISNRYLRLRAFFKNPFRYLQTYRYLISGRIFEVDSALMKLVGSEHELRCTVLIAPRNVLISRMSRRKAREILLFNQRRYQKEIFARVLSEINLARLYSIWIHLLESNHISYEIIRSTDERYCRINSYGEMMKTLVDGEGCHSGNDACSGT